MRNLYVGNVDNNTHKSELERSFSEYGKVDRVEMKNGYAFVYFENEHEAENAIQGLNNTLFGVERRNITVGWAKGKFRHGKPALEPSKRLFVVNFDPIKTKEHHIETHFKPYGKLVDVRIIRHYSFVEFEREEDATKALNATQGSMILDKPITIEYATKGSYEESDHYRNRRRSQDYGAPDSSVEYAAPDKNKRDDRHGSPAELKPTKTLFVINFDTVRITNDDIKRHFEAYGDVLNIHNVDNYSFVQFATQEDATQALKATQRSKILDRVISVEYASPDKNQRDGRHRSRSHRSPAYERRRRDRTRSPRAGYDRCRNRSGSPERRRRS